MESMTNYLNDQNVKGSLDIIIADTPEKRSKGLSDIGYMNNNEGMLFIYPKTIDIGFTSKDMSIDLDIAFISDRGEILDIRQLFAGDTRIVKSSVPFQKALEVHLGWFQHHGISVGHRVLVKGTKAKII